MRDEQRPLARECRLAKDRLEESWRRRPGGSGLEGRGEQWRAWSAKKFAGEREKEKSVLKKK